MLNILELYCMSCHGFAGMCAPFLPPNHLSKSLMLETARSHLWCHTISFALGVFSMCCGVIIVMSNSAPRRRPAELPAESRESRASTSFVPSLSQTKFSISRGPARWSPNIEKVSRESISGLSCPYPNYKLHASAQSTRANRS
jgi:hypothetical protein